MIHNRGYSMNHSSLRWLAGAAIAGVAVSALVAPAAQAAPADAAFCADGSQPMVSKAETEAFDETTTVRGLTVVKGTTPVQFTGTFAGAIDDALSNGAEGADLLLFDLKGAGIDAASTPSGATPAGIWAGMSGSPVYTDDGRLIGAVAYGLTPDNIAVAGITPAYYMKKIGQSRLASPAKVTITKSNLDAASPKRAAKLLGQSPQWLKTVKVVSGGQRANALANRTLARTPAVSPAAKSARAGGFAAVAPPSQIDAPLVAGGNIAVGYATGDLFTGGVGTVTAICGTTVWAFGHPMDWAGETSLSMHNASAAMIFPDSTGAYGSYKQVAKIGQQLGTITTDAFAGIRGQVGLLRGFPVKTNVKNAAGKLIDTYSGTVVNPDFGAFGAAFGAAFAAQDVLDNVGTGSAKLSWRIDYRLSNGRTGSLRNSQVYAGNGDLTEYLAGDIGNDVASLGFTDLADVTITSITSNLTLRSDKALDYRFAGAQKWTGKTWVKLRGSSVKAGRAIKVRPVYRQYVNGRPKGTSTGPTKKFTIGKNARSAKVTFGPRNAAPSKDDCIVIDDEMLCPDFGDEGGQEEPESFAELLAVLDSLVPSDRASASAQWNWKVGKSKGTSQRSSGLVAPGPVSGSYSATLRVRR